MSGTVNAALSAGSAIPAAVLGGQYDVFPDRSLPDFAVGTAPAVAAVDRQAPDRALFALLCEAPWQPRYAAIPAVGRVQHAGLLTPVAAGFAEVTGSPRRIFAIVHERKIGKRLAAPDASGAAPLDPDRVLQHVLLPAAATLRAIHAAGLTHRAIRPDNLFWRDDAESEVRLGDCLAAPPAAAQPVWCETIESGLAHPLARGDGLPVDDLYALGATALFLALGRTPGAGLDGAALLHAKIERGSYAALAGDAKLPTALAEGIAGLLADEPRRRWTLDELQAWLRGKGPPLRHVAATRTARAFAFDDRDFTNPRLLADALAAKPVTAAPALRDELFAAWVRRWCPERWPSVEQVLSAQATRMSPTADELLVARVSMALDPAAPIRFKGLAMNADGLGPLLGAALAGGLPLQPVAAAIVGRLPQFWLAMQPTPHPKAAALRPSLDEVARLVEHRDIGCGAERGFYQLVPEAPCLSPLVEGMGVARAEAMLAAFNVAAATRPFAIDRHAAAFLASRFKSNAGDWLPGLSSSDPAEPFLATLRLLYRLQEGFGPASVPALTGALVKQAGPAVDRYRNRAVRQSVAEALDGIAARGRVGELLALLDDPVKRRGDTEAFRGAQQEYARTQEALGALGRRMRRRSEAAAALGARWAAGLAGAAAGIGLLVTALVMR